MKVRPSPTYLLPLLFLGFYPDNPPILPVVFSFLDLFVSLSQFSSAFVSFRVKSPKITENLNPIVSDFNETWYTCSLGTHSTKSKKLGQSDKWCGRYGPPNFESFGKNGRGCQPLNPHISGTSDPIFIKLVLMDRQFDKDSKYVILVQIGECLGALTFRPLL